VGTYLTELADRGYRESTLNCYGRSIIQFGEFLEEQGVRELTALPGWIEPFIAKRAATAYRAANWRSMLNRFAAHLRRKGLIPAPDVPSTTTPHAELIDQYVRFQREHRGVCEEYAKNTKGYCQAFLTYLDAQGVTDLGAIEPEMIHRFISLEGNRYSRKSMSGRCSMLRGLLAFLYRRGVTSTDLSQLVVAPRMYKHEQCPRFITRAQVQDVLASVDRSTPQGRRDYAALSLLVTYGLRGIEVIRLRLEDIDWRNEALHIRSRKAGNNTTYPLASWVGEAILAYLEDGRPKSPYRELFLSVKAPFRPLVYTAALGIMVRKHMALVDVQVDRPGTHTFRYSCAQRLLDQDFPLKSIGDYLGHRVPDTTLGYTKMAIKQLREVALGDGEDLL
jgi:site-specific recombinase XerD